MEEENLSVRSFGVSLTNHVICNMHLNIPFIVENHLTLDALIGLLLRKQVQTELLRHIHLLIFFLKNNNKKTNPTWSQNFPETMVLYMLLNKCL